jgi:hypothetical protein
MAAVAAVVEVLLLEQVVWAVEVMVPLEPIIVELLEL